MRRIYLLSALFLLSGGFFSCKKGSEGDYIPPTYAKLIVGKWVLQTEHSVQYVNSVKQLDTVYNASQNSYVSMQFNSNGTFTTSGAYYSVVQPGSLSSAAPSVVNFTGSGAYSFAGTTLNMTGNVPGFANGTTAYGLSTTTSVPVITLISNSVQINELTAANLALHVETVYTYTANNTSQTYKLVNDLSYTR